MPSNNLTHLNHFCRNQFNYISIILLILILVGVVLAEILKRASAKVNNCNNRTNRNPTFGAIRLQWYSFGQRNDLFTHFRSLLADSTDYRIKSKAVVPTVNLLHFSLCASSKYRRSPVLWVLSISALSKNIRLKFLLLHFFYSSHIFGLVQYEFYTDENCYSNATLPQHSHGMQQIQQQTVDECDYNVAMNVSRYDTEIDDWERERTIKNEEELSAKKWNNTALYYYFLSISIRFL